MKQESNLTLSSHDIALTGDTGIGPGLLCPRCKGNCLHHGKVTVFDRAEDAELTAVTMVYSGLTATHLRPSKEVANPSDRRDGIAIAFWCEGCEGDLELTISQHKGSTYLTWRFEPAQTGARTPART